MGTKRTSAESPARRPDSSPRRLWRSLSPSSGRYLGRSDQQTVGRRRPLSCSPPSDGFGDDQPASPPSTALFETAIKVTSLVGKALRYPAEERGGCEPRWGQRGGTRTTRDVTVSTILWGCNSENSVSVSTCDGF